MSNYPDHVIAGAVSHIEDLLTMLNVDPDERGGAEGGDHRTTAELIAEAVLHGAGVSVDVKRPIVFGYNEHQQWLPGHKRLVSEWVEDDVYCSGCHEQIVKLMNGPWVSLDGSDDVCGVAEVAHVPRRG